MNAPAILSIAHAERFSQVALANIAREYPAKLDHVLASDDDAALPRALHPSFHGSYDWHSCVHMHWLLARLRRRFPGLACRGEIAMLFDARLSASSIAVECAYLDRPCSISFERTYGWAWLLKLAAELRRHDDRDGVRWSRALAPLAGAFERRYLDYLPNAGYAIRHGMHANSAFGLLLALGDAGDDAPPAVADRGDRRHLREACRRAALAWYAGDRDAPIGYEPSGADFLSPSLVEAALMRHVLDAPEFGRWLTAFLPGLGSAPEVLVEPVSVADRGDPQTVHLDGLNLSRAWCLAGIARGLPPDDQRVRGLRAASGRHLEAGWRGLESGHYAGRHWLATFALLAVEAREGND